MNEPNRFNMDRLYKSEEKNKKLNVTNISPSFPGFPDFLDIGSNELKQENMDGTKGHKDRSLFVQFFGSDISKDHACKSDVSKGDFQFFDHFRRFFDFFEQQKYSSSNCSHARYLHLGVGITVAFSLLL